MNTKRAASVREARPVAVQTPKKSARTIAKTGVAAAATSPPPKKRTLNPKLEKYKWEKGCPSPNPQGRPKGIIKLVRSLTDDTESLVKLMVGIANGDPLVVSITTMTGVQDVQMRPSVKDRKEAATWLLEQVHGKARQTVGIGGDPEQPLEITVRFADAPERL